MFLSPLVRYISFFFCLHVYPKCYIIEHFFFCILFLDAFFNCRNFLNCEFTVSYVCTTIFVCLTLIVQYYGL